jgi:23S rRNA pseudouridine2605 synthase
VNRLIRIAYGPFQLGKLERGEVEEVPKRVLHDQVAKFFADRGDKPEAPNTGTAKAKPRPKPRHTSAAHAAKPGGGGGSGPGSRPGGGRTSAGRTPEGKHETRRR